MKQLGYLSEFVKKENIEKSYNLGKKALYEIEEIIKQNSNKCKYIKRDTLLYSNKKEDIKQLEQEYEFRKNMGLNVELLKENQKEFEFDLKAGVYSKDGGVELDPYLFTHQLLQIAKNNNAKIYENTEVEKIKYNENDLEVITSYGNIIKAKKVIIATGYETDKFTNKNFGNKTITFNIVTKPIKNLKINKSLIRDTNNVYNYYRTTTDNRIIAGGEDIEYINSNFTQDKANEKYEILEQRLKQLYKKENDKEELEIEYKYCGAFCSTKDNLGFIGTDKKHKNQWYCLGYGANGILFAILGAISLVKLYNNEKDDDIFLFDVNRFD